MLRERTIPRPSGLGRVGPHAPARERGIDWAAAGWAGLVAGIIFILFESALISLFGAGSSPDAIRRIAAIALGQSFLSQPAPFTWLVFATAMAVHLPLSLLYARLLAALVRGLSAARAGAVGCVFGACVYAVNFYAFTGIFPWFAAARGWMTLSSHVLFGIVAAEVYVLLTQRRD